MKGGIWGKGDGIPRALAAFGRGVVVQPQLNPCIIVVVRAHGRGSRRLCWGVAADKDTAIAITTVLTAATAVHEAHHRTLQPVVPDLAPVVARTHPCISSDASRAVAHRASSHTDARLMVSTDA